jgi:hypothetical protein
VARVALVDLAARVVLALAVSTKTFPSYRCRATVAVFVLDNLRVSQL